MNEDKLEGRREKLHNMEREVLEETQKKGEKQNYLQ